MYMHLHGQFSSALLYLAGSDSALIEPWDSVLAPPAGGWCATLQWANFNAAPRPASLYFSWSRERLIIENCGFETESIIIVTDGTKL